MSFSWDWMAFATSGRPFVVMDSAPIRSPYSPKFLE